MRVRHRRAVGLLIEEVAPSAHGLTEGQPRRDQIRKRPEGNLLHPRVDPARQHAADHAAVDGQPAAAYVQYLRRMGGVVVPGEDHIVQPRTEDPDRHADQRQIQRGFPFQAQPLFPEPGQQHRAQHAQGDQHAVPVNREAEDGQRAPSQFKHTMPPQSLPIIIILARKCQYIIIAPASIMGYNTQ